jgi:low temperature requirement protein LtrA
MPVLLTRMTARDPHEEHRVATPLELFFDLVFVVAVAFAASALHHDIAEDHIRHGLVSYLLVFFAIWWAWVNFTWFASAFDIGDVPYKLLVLTQMTGALILAAGIPKAFEERDFTIVVAGYVVMRLALVCQWLRVAWQDPDNRSAALRFAIGIGTVQAGWVLWNIFFDGSDTASLVLFLSLAMLEMLVPVWAEQAGATHWHPEHIAERYGLFTIIVLGESVLASSTAIQSIEDLKNISGEMAFIIAGGLLILFAMWWLYFGFPAHGGLDTLRPAIVWSYGHYFIWAAAAATGAGLSVAVDFATDHAAIGSVAAGYALAVPVAVYILGLWVFHDLQRHRATGRGLLMPIAAALILLTPFTSIPEFLTGLILVGLAVVKTVVDGRSSELRVEG